MCASRINCRALAFMLFFMTMSAAQMGFSDERPRKGDSQKKAGEITSFKLIGKGGLYGATPFVFVYHSPYKWRSEENLGPIFGKTVFICDGKTAWSYLVEQNKVTDIKKWDAEKIVEKYGQKVTYDYLLAFGGAPFLTVANPAHPRWKNEFSFSSYDPYGFTRKAEEMINKTASVLYESKHPAITSRHWFGKEDGLIRKDEMISAGDRVREMIVDEVVINPKVANDVFHFTPPPRAKVIDKTDTLFKAIEEDKRRYQIFIEQRRKKKSEKK